MNPSEIESLRKLLRQWKVAEPLPPRFKEQVWRRIEQRPGAASAWELWQQWLATVFVRKSVALAYVTVLMAVGLTAGYFNGQAQEQQSKAQLAARYVQSLDPSQHNPD